MALLFMLLPGFIGRLSETLRRVLRKKHRNHFDRTVVSIHSVADVVLSHATVLRGNCLIRRWSGSRSIVSTCERTIDVDLVVSEEKSSDPGISIGSKQHRPARRDRRSSSISTTRATSKPIEKKNQGNSLKIIGKAVQETDQAKLENLNGTISAVHVHPRRFHKRGGWRKKPVRRNGFPQKAQLNRSRQEKN